MRRYPAWWSVGAVVMAAVAACGDDPPSQSGTPASGGTGGDATGLGGASGGDQSPSDAGTGQVLEGGAAGMPSTPGAAGAGPSAGAGGEGGAPLPVSKDVHGTVMSAHVPWSGAVVRVNDVTVTSDTDGGFVVEDAPDEYQLVVYLPEQKFVRIYDAVRGRQPVVDLGYGFGLGEEKSATIRGKVSGGLTAPFPAYTYTEARYVSKTRGHLRTSFFDPPEAYDLDPHWSDGGDVDEGEIWVFQTIEPPGVGPTDYVGFGRRDVTITAGDILGSASGSALTDVTLTEPEELSLSGTLTGPVGFTMSADTIRVGAWWTYAQIDLGAFSVLFPKLDGIGNLLNVDLKGVGVEAARMYWQPPAQGPWDLVVPPPPTHLTPPAAADAVTTQTVFTWSNMPTDAAAVLNVVVGEWLIQRVTTAQSTTLFDPMPFGVSLPVATEGRWAIEAVGPAANADEAMAVYHADVLDTSAPRFFINSDWRPFTTAP